MRGEPRELAVFEPGDDGRTILGRVAAKGLADELRDRSYLVIDGVDGKAHYVALNARDELATLRNRELAQATKNIATETGLEHRPVGDGQRVAGIYWRNVMLASGRDAMLDDGKGFSLVPWKPVIEQRLGLAGVNYLGRPASTIVTGGSGE